MALLEGLCSTPRGGPAVECAGELVQLLQRHRLLTTRPSMDRWASEFTALLKLYDEGTVRSVLAWLGTAARAPYTPRVFSASTFKAKFPALLDAAVRAGAAVRGSAITPEAYAVLEAAGRPGWPGTEAADEAQFVQDSLDTYRRFRAEVLEAGTSGRISMGLAEYLVAVAPQPAEFVRQWVEEIHRTAWEWSGWNGDLLQHSVSYSSRRFRFVVRAWLRGYMGPAVEAEWLFNRLGVHEDR